MNFKKLLVSFVMLVSTLFLLSTVSAVAVTDNAIIKINGIDIVYNPSVIAGELVTVEVEFTTPSSFGNDSSENPILSTSDVEVTVELEGDKVDVEGTTAPFDVISGKTYKKSMILRVPFELQEDVSDTLNLNLKIEGKNVDSYTPLPLLQLSVQRPSYNVDFMSVNTEQAEAGKTLSVDVVLKNTGYNKLDDLYVTVSIPELNVERTVYARDLVTVKIDEDNDDTVEVTVEITVPYNAVEGTYDLEVKATNNDMDLKSVKQIFVKNAFSSKVIVSGNEIVLLNPTGSLMALRLIPETPEGVSVTLSEDVVVIPAGESASVTVSATGSQEYTLNVFTMNGELVESVTLAASSESAGSNVVTVLTAVLLVVFLVLLAVLVVLVTKKPEKDEEFSESYY